MSDSPRSSPLRIAIAGNPNSGKTTLFNALTGLRQKVANYAGVTVEKREAALIGTDTLLLDLPGTYSLSARSPDEEIARDVIQGRATGVPRPDAVLIVLDASNLERNLYLTTQIIEFGIPVIIACNMMDVAEAQGIHIDCAKLAQEFDVPVYPVVARNGTGIGDLRGALRHIKPCPLFIRKWKLPGAFESAVEQVAVALDRVAILPPRASKAAAMLWLMDYLSGEANSRAAADRFLAKLPYESAQELRSTANELSKSIPDAASVAIEARYEWISTIAARVRIQDSRASLPSPLSDRIDRILTHRVFGLIIFAAIMFVLFLSVFWWAEPLMNLIESGKITLSAVVATHMSDGPLRSLITDGVIAGVGTVVSFFPQICILFFCLALLEDTGYMARAAFLMDRLMSRVGLHGKSFIPLLSSYACAIPGIMATRTIENRRDRFTTILIAPLMSCSARLPVYIIVIGALFGERPWTKAGVMFSLYALGTLTAMLMALIFKKTLFAGHRPPFIMELPAYHMPRLWPLVRAMWDRSKLFLTNAGTMIFAVCIVIWAMSYFPRLTSENISPQAKQELARLDAVHDSAAHANLLAAEHLRQSYIGRLGRFIEPAIKPLGYDWRLGIGILSSFLAREVFVGAMGITFAVGEPGEHTEALRTQLATATWPNGGKVLTTAAGLSLLVFYVLACQCVSTLAVVRKETGSWRWPAFMFCYMSLLAYVAALAVFQIGSRFF